jgi:hypothetical protein
MTDTTALGNATNQAQLRSIHTRHIKRPNQSMKPTPKVFASSLVPWRILVNILVTHPARGLSLSR